MTSTKRAHFPFPAIDALLPLIRRWAAQSTDPRAGSYTPEEEEDAEVDRSPRPEAPARRHRSALRGATRGGGAKAKAKRLTIATLAQDMGSMLGPLPKISAELERLSDRQIALEARLQGGHRHCP